jgi:predicted small metal-binding protein
MTKVLRCGDMMTGCDYVARAESEDELMQKAAQRDRMRTALRFRQRSSSGLRAR